jgi:hypothetical protein
MSMSRELPVPKAVKDLFEELLGRPVTVGIGEPFRPPDLKAQPLVSTYVDDRMTLRAVIGMDLPLAAYAGAALGLIPAGGAKACIEDKELSANVAENITEVCNILSSLLNHEGQPRLRMHETYLPGNPAPTDAAGQLQAIGRRLDLNVDVQGYGQGRMAFSYVL